MLPKTMTKMQGDYLEKLGKVWSRRCPISNKIDTLLEFNARARSRCSNRESVCCHEYDMQNNKPPMKTFCTIMTGGSSNGFRVHYENLALHLACKKRQDADPGLWSYSVRYTKIDREYECLQKMHRLDE